MGMSCARLNPGVNDRAKENLPRKFSWSIHAMGIIVSFEISVNFAAGKQLAL
jgi:hypothetical protein